MWKHLEGTDTVEHVNNSWQAFVREGEARQPDLGSFKRVSFDSLSLTLAWTNISILIALNAHICCQLSIFSKVPGKLSNKDHADGGCEKF